MAVNRAVSSHLGRVRLPGLAFRTRRSWARADGTVAPGWLTTPGLIEVFTVRDCDASWADGPLRLGARGGGQFDGDAGAGFRLDAVPFLSRFAFTTSPPVTVKA